MSQRFANIEVRGARENNLENISVDISRRQIVIEHNVVVRADWVIDMGPGAGAEGRKVVFEGVPRELVKASKSLTGKHLAARLGN